MFTRPAKQEWNDKVQGEFEANGVAWGQATKSVSETHRYSDIFCDYHLNGLKWEFNAEYSRSYFASLKKGLICSREARKCAGEDKVCFRFMRRKWDLTMRCDEWAWYFRRGNRPYQKDEYRWAKKWRALTRQKQQKQNASHRIAITVQQLFIRITDCLPRCRLNWCLL